jgi:hypothetical protein
MVMVIFMPAFLVCLIDFNIRRLGWFWIYLMALPIWQIILPLYAFWRFDDFSWGATRQVDGVAKDEGHGGDESREFNESVVPLRRWDDYERAWRNSLLLSNVPAMPLSIHTLSNSTDPRLQSVDAPSRFNAASSMESPRPVMTQNYMNVPRSPVVETPMPSAGPIRMRDASQTTLNDEKYI